MNLLIVSSLHCVFYISVSSIQSLLPVYEEIFGGTRYEYHIYDVFPHSPVGKESACNAGDPSLIPGLGRFAGEGISKPFPFPWASLVAQLVKNLPAMWETWAASLGWEDPLEKEKATHSSILA